MSDEPRNYLLRKRGMWWQRDFAGYTNNLWDAGRYTKSEAMQRTHSGRKWRGQIDENVYAIPMKQVIAGIERDLKAACEEASALAELLILAHTPNVRRKKP